MGAVKIMAKVCLYLNELYGTVLGCGAVGWIRPGSGWFG